MFTIRDFEPAQNQASPFLTQWHGLVWPWNRRTIYPSSPLSTEIGFLCVALAALECTVSTKLALSSQRSVYLCLPSPGIEGVYHKPSRWSLLFLCLNTYQITQQFKHVYDGIPKSLPNSHLLPNNSPVFPSCVQSQAPGLDTSSLQSLCLRTSS